MAVAEYRESLREIPILATVVVRWLRAGHTNSLSVKAYPLTLSASRLLHVNSMHLFGDAELEQGLRPQAEVGALAV